MSDLLVVVVCLNDYFVFHEMVTRAVDSLLWIEKFSLLSCCRVRIVTLGTIHNLRLRY